MLGYDPRALAANALGAFVLAFSSALVAIPVADFGSLRQALEPAAVAGLLAALGAVAAVVRGSQVGKRLAAARTAGLEDQLRRVMAERDRYVAAAIDRSDAVRPIVLVGEGTEAEALAEQIAGAMAAKWRPDRHPSGGGPVPDPDLMAWAAATRPGVSATR